MSRYAYCIIFEHFTIIYVAHLWLVITTKPALSLMENNNKQLLKRLVFVYSMLLMLFVAEFWIDTRNIDSMDSKFVMNNNLTPYFGLFVREYNLWKFSDGRMSFSANAFGR